MCIRWAVCLFIAQDGPMVASNFFFNPSCDALDCRELKFWSGNSRTELFK